MTPSIDILDTFPIRLATPADADDLARLRYRFRADLGATNESEDAFVARAGAWFATRLATPQWRGWIAHDPAAEIVGHVFIQFVEKIPNPVVEAELIGYITNAYVLPAYRSQGVGRRLLEIALAACEAGLVDTVVLWPTAKSAPLYRRLGFDTPAKLMEKPIRG